MLHASLRSLTRPLGVPSRFSSPFTIQTANLAYRGTRLDARGAEFAREAQEDVEDATVALLSSQPPPGPAPSESFHVLSREARKRVNDHGPQDVLFVKPSDLRDSSNEPPRMGRKRPLLGPGAAESKAQDWFYQLGIDPLYEATNPRLLSFFVSEMGKVKSRADTKLTWRSQRRLTKAIRRAKMMGVMPILHRHTSREGL